MLWSYTALAADGSIVKDSKKAESRFALLQDIKSEGLTVISVTESEGDSAEDSTTGFQFPWVGIPNKVVTLFTRQLADLCDAGVPLTESLRSLGNFEPSQKFADVLDSVYKKILQGQGFSAALKEHPEVFPEIYVNMVRVGESSGRLPDVLAGLADFRERDDELKGKLKSALSYPIFTLAFSLVLCWALVAHVLPGFIPIWTGSGLDLHKYPITEALISINKFTKSFVDETILAALLVGLYLGYKSLMRTSEAQHARDAFVLKLPGLRGFIQMGAIARVCNTLGVLIRSGVGLVPALQLSADTTSNTLHREALLQVSKDVQEGNSFSEALAKQDVFPPMMTQMVGIGEQSGNLDDMFPRMANYYDRQLEGALKTLVGLMEPATMVLVGGVVFVFILGIFLPIMGIVQALQSQM